MSSLTSRTRPIPSTPRVEGSSTTQVSYAGPGPNVATATAMASSTLLPAAVNASVVVRVAQPQRPAEHHAGGEEDREVDEQRGRDADHVQGSLADRAALQESLGFPPGLNAGAFNLGAGLSFAVLHAVTTAFTPADPASHSGPRSPSRARSTPRPPARAASRWPSTDGAPSGAQCDSRATSDPLDPTRKSRSAPVSACWTWST